MLEEDVNIKWKSKRMKRQQQVIQGHPRIWEAWLQNALSILDSRGSG